MRDSARFSILPDATPLALQHAPDFSYVAVEVRHVPEPEREVSQQDLEVELQAGHWPTTKVAGGDRALRRVPHGEWQQDAARIAEELTRAVVCTRAELIVVPRDSLPLADGVGAQLRYHDADT